MVVYPVKYGPIEDLKHALRERRTMGVFQKGGGHCTTHVRTFLVHDIRLGCLNVRLLAGAREVLGRVGVVAAQRPMHLRHGGAAQHSTAPGVACTSREHTESAYKAHNTEVYLL